MPVLISAVKVTIVKLKKGLELVLHAGAKVTGETTYSNRVGRDSSPAFFPGASPSGAASVVSHMLDDRYIYRPWEQGLNHCGEEWYFCCLLWEVLRVPAQMSKHANGSLDLPRPQVLISLPFNVIGYRHCIFIFEMMFLWLVSGTPDFGS